MKIKFSPLNKRIKRELKDNFGRYIALFLMFASIIAITGGFLASASCMQGLVTDGPAKYRLEDGQFTSAAALSDRQLSAAKACSDSSIYESFHKDHEIGNDTTLRYYKIRTDINLQSVAEGTLPETDSEVAIDRVFAAQNNLEIGDFIDGFKISGTISLPDYTSLYEDNSDTMLNTKTFGVALLNSSAFEQLDGNIIYTYSYRTQSHENGSLLELSKKEQYDLLKELTQNLYSNGVQVSSAMSADSNQAISFLKDDMGSDVPMMKTLFYIVLIIIAFVFVIITDHTIESEAVIIGTLLANGYRKREIIRHYTLLPCIISIAAEFVGNLLAYTIFLKFFEDVYYNTYSLPNCKVSFNMEAFLLTSALPFILMLVITWFGIARKLSHSPLQFLHKDIKHHSSKGAMKLPAFSFITRFRIRVLLQNLANYIILFIGIFLASFLLMFGLGMKPLFTDYVEKVDDTLFAENQYLLTAPVEADGGDKVTIVTLSFYNEPMGKYLSVVLYGVDGLKDRAVTDSDVLVSNVLLKKQKTDVSSVLHLLNEYTEKEYDIQPTEEFEYNDGFALVLSRKHLNEIMEYEPDYFNGYLSDKKLDIDDLYIKKLITRRDMTKMADQMLSSLSGMLPMFIGVSVIIYMVLMYILTKLTIDKNALSISFLKVFGYENREVKKLFLHGGTFTVFVSLLLCIPLEYLGLQVALNLVTLKMSAYLEADLPLTMYLEVAAVGLLSYLIISFILTRQINRIPMTEALKNRE